MAKMPGQQYNTVTTDSGQELILPEQEEPKKYNTPIYPEDFEPISEDDEDFPKEEPGSTTLPAVNLKAPLPKNILPEKKQSRILGWTDDEVKIVNRQTGIFMQMPMVCNGTAGCQFGSICPVVNRDSFIGKSCPLEIMELFKHFSGYVRDQNITPDDYTDLQLVADLCRQHLILWRTDMALRTEREIVDEVGVVVQKTGVPFYRPIISKNRELQRYAREAIIAIYKQLIATRSERRKSDPKTNTEALSELFARITDNNNKK